MASKKQLSADAPAFVPPSMDAAAEPEAAGVAESKDDEDGGEYKDEQAADFASFDKTGAKAGAKASFGTNPLCFACPVEGRSPFVFDMSTAAIALFGVLTCKAKGQPLPPQSAYDANGNWTRKVEDIHIGGGKGAIANFGGHKGTGLALMVELLCAALAVLLMIFGIGRWTQK